MKGSQLGESFLDVEESDNGKRGEERRGKERRERDDRHL